MIPNEEFWRVRSAILLAMRSEGPEQLDSLAESLKDKVDNDTGRRLPVEAYRLLYAAVLIGRLTGFGELAVDHGDTSPLR